MPKLNQKARGMYETPQITADQLATPIYGGDAPTHVDIIKSANARAQMRHEMKRQGLADLEVLPDSAESAGNEMIGVRNSGYLTKKGLEYGVNSMTFSLPPGMDIEDQEIADIRRMGINTQGGMPTPYAQGDRTRDINPKALRKGFDKKKLLQTDDAYTREHNDAFYDDVGGFVERNNMLDRM